MIGRELVYSTRYDANRKVGFEVSFYSDFILVYKSKKTLFRGTLEISESYDHERSMKKAEIINFFFQVFLFGLLEARGEGESRARIRCLPVRQSKSDSKMG